MIGTILDGILGVPVMVILLDASDQVNRGMLLEHLVDYRGAKSFRVKEGYL